MIWVAVTICQFQIVFMCLLNTFVCVWLSDCTVVTVHILNAMGILNWLYTFIFVRCMVYKVDTLLLLLFGSWIWERNNKTAEFHVINVSKWDFFCLVFCFLSLLRCSLLFFSAYYIAWKMDGTGMICNNRIEFHSLVKSVVQFWQSWMSGVRKCVSFAKLFIYFMSKWNKQTFNKLIQHMYTHEPLRMDTDWRMRRISRISLFTLSILRC